MKLKLTLITRLYSISLVCFLVSMLILVLSFNSTEVITIHEKLRKTMHHKLNKDTVPNNTSINREGKIFIYSDNN